MIKIITFFELFTSFFVLIRVSDDLTEKNLIDKRTYAQIFISFFASLVVFAFISRFSRFLFSVFLWSGVLATLTAPYFLLPFRRRQFRREIPILLNNLILKMRSGVAFRTSLKESLPVLSPYSAAKIEKILESLDLANNTSETYTLQRDPDVNRLLTFFRIIDCEAHKALQRLTLFRKQLKDEEFFRSRVQRALSQLRAQSFVMSSLYVGLVIFVVHRFGWRAHAGLIFTSIIIFILGQFISLSIGRGFKWKV